MLGFIKKLFGLESVDVQTLLQKGALVLDVRTPQEYKGGHPQGAQNIPLQAIPSQIQQIKKKNKVIITCCASGMRSGVAAKQLKAAGIEAYNGGSWRSVAKFTG